MLQTRLYFDRSTSLIAFFVTSEFELSMFVKRENAATGDAAAAAWHERLLLAAGAQCLHQPHDDVRAVRDV